MTETRRIESLKNTCVVAEEHNKKCQLEVEK